MRHMGFSELRNLITRELAVITGSRSDGGFGKIVKIIVDNKHEYEVHLSGAQALALNVKES